MSSWRNSLLTAWRRSGAKLRSIYACSEPGYQATIFVPETSPPEKIDRIGEHGAEVNVIPGYYHQALVACEAFVADTGAFMPHAYDQPEVVAGQGTAAREIVSQANDVDSVVVAVGEGVKSQASPVGSEMIKLWLQRSPRDVAVTTQRLPRVDLPR